MQIWLLCGKDFSPSEMFSTVIHTAPVYNTCVHDKVKVQGF